MYVVSRVVSIFFICYIEWSLKLGWQLWCSNKQSWKCHSRMKINFWNKLVTKSENSDLNDFLGFGFLFCLCSWDNPRSARGRRLALSGMSSRRKSSSYTDLNTMGSKFLWIGTHFFINYNKWYIVCLIAN